MWRKSCRPRFKFGLLQTSTTKQNFGYNHSPSQLSVSSLLISCQNSTFWMWCHLGGSKVYKKPLYLVDKIQLNAPQTQKPSCLK
jgi:hypothetical protein